jgi:outer membrane protein assembly factor BamA
VRSEVARDPYAFGGIGALGAASAAADRSETELYVRFYVDEGPHEVCDGVEIAFTGDHMKKASDLARVLKLKAGSPYTEDAVQDDARRITIAYRKLGRPYVQADYAASTWNADHTRIHVRYRVTEGPEVRFGEILIRGNFKTHARVIRLDLPFHTGDLFDVDKLEEGERNLQTHFIFDSVRATPAGLDAHRNPVPILITVRERYLDWGGFVSAVGVSSDRLPYYWYVSLAYQWNNVLGFGSQLELRGDFDWINSWGVLGRYTDLHAFGPKWRFDVTGFYRKELTNRLGEITTYGASLSLSRYLTKTLRLYVRYDNYLSETGVGIVRFPSTNERASVGDNTHTAKIGGGIVWDRRVGADGNPNPLAPVKGWLLQAQLAWAFPTWPDGKGGPVVALFSSDHNFLVVAGQAMFIQPFRIRSSTFTFLANLRYDQGIPFGATALPAVERYFAGGDTTTRGYETDELKTEIVRSPISPLPGEAGFRVIAEGGNIRVLSTLEMQFPIAKTFIGLPIQWVGAIFYDVGSVFDSWNTVNPSDVKQSIGGTFLRLLTPFGPLSLEYAYPINPGLAEERWKSNPWYTHWPGRIHFNWGIPLARF